MKIAVPSKNDMVSAHLGHCENFTIYDTEDNHIIKIENVEFHRGDNTSLPDFLKSLGVLVVIAGDISKEAYNSLDAEGMEIVTGAEGDAQIAVGKYLAGELIPTEEFF